MQMQCSCNQLPVHVKYICSAIGIGSFQEEIKILITFRSRLLRCRKHDKFCCRREKHETLTSVENCRLISTRKIPNRLIKSGKHNLLCNIQHSRPFFVLASHFCKITNLNADEATQRMEKIMFCLLAIAKKGENH